MSAVFPAAQAASRIRRVSGSKAVLRYKKTVRAPRNAGCAVTVRTQEHGEPILRIPVETCTTEKGFTGELPAGLGEKEALYFSVEGKGGTFDFVSFDLA